MRIVHETAEAGEVLLSQSLDCLQNPDILPNHVAGTLELVTGEALEILFPRIPQLVYAPSFCAAFSQVLRRSW